MNRFAFDHPDDAIDAIAERLASIPTEQVDLDGQAMGALTGRVLATDVVADRDSPAADVSAMDGYATTDAELVLEGEVPVLSESVPGSQPPLFHPGGVVRIFTGAIVPEGADRVIQREETVEMAGQSEDPSDLGTIRWLPAAQGKPIGTNIRRQGENIRGGEKAVSCGQVLHAAQLGAIVNFGVQQLEIYRQVKVAILTTGDELESQANAADLPPWKIRNSNRDALRSVLAGARFVSPPTCYHSSDDPKQLQSTLRDAMMQHDLVLLTGGVSMGDHDYVPQVVRQCGAEILFHKLPLRPGKPILGAVYDGPDSGSPVALLGLPGNPVSATMGAVRFGLPLASRLAGMRNWRTPQAMVSLESVGQKTLPLYWMRAVRLTRHGYAELVIGKGSGDLVTLAQSDGFIEMPPHADSPGPWPFYRWSV